jgi:hypothetical protein
MVTRSPQSMSANEQAERQERRHAQDSDQLQTGLQTTSPQHFIPQGNDAGWMAEVCCEVNRIVEVKGRPAVL